MIYFILLFVLLFFLSRTKTQKEKYDEIVDEMNRYYDNLILEHKKTKIIEASKMLY